MNKLEQTIIKAAEQSLQEFKAFSDIPESDDLLRSMHELTAYVYLAHMEGSVLSEEAVKKLNELNHESLQTMKAWMEE